MTLGEALGRRLFVPRVLWFALLSTNAIYFFVARTVAPTTPVDGASALLLPLVGAAVASAVASFVLPWHFQRIALRRVPEGALAESPTELARLVIAGYSTPLILSLALSESISIDGLVLALQGLPLHVYGPFIAAGALLIAVRFPTRARALGPLAARLPPNAWRV